MRHANPSRPTPLSKFDSGWLGLLLLFALVGAAQAQERGPREEAVSLAIAGQYEEALARFTDLLHDAPEDPLLNYYSGVACVRLKRTAEGMGYLERAVRYQARFPQAYAELADLYLKKKLPAEAAKVLDKGLKLFPKNQSLLDLQKRLTESQENAIH